MLLTILCNFLLLISPTQAYSPYSNQELDQLEKQFIQQINHADNVIRVPLANEYINHLAKTLASHGQMTQPTFFIVNSREINAFAGPGGYIGINSQLILASSTESELAGVMAHEMAHVRLHHLYQMIEHEKQMRIPMLATMLASIALGVVNPSLGTGALMASMGGYAQESINFVRANEKEADSIGISMLIKTDLDPHGMATFFRKMQENSRYYFSSSNMPAILRTHPLDDDRIAEAENRIANLPKIRDPNHLEYRLFKEIIRTSVSKDTKQLMDYYQHQCTKKNNDLACNYGYVLAYLNNNQFQQARLHLMPLLAKEPDNLYFIIAMAQAESGEGKFADATQRLSDVLKNHPDNYAVLSEYGNVLLYAGKADLATSTFLKGTRIYKHDLPFCRQLARSFAANHQKGYAYFTEAQCYVMEGEIKEARRMFILAKTMAAHDEILRERIDAKMEELGS